jgi:sulfate adenylyltransferase
MNKDNWQSVCDNMVMTNGIFWPIPITLSSDDEAINVGDEISIVYEKNNEIIATMVISEKYAIDKIHECNKVFKTTDAEHPGVALVMAQGKYNLAGKIKVLSNGGFPSKYGDLYMTPSETRAYFEEKGWSSIAAFQTRNPMHRSHEYLAKIAIEICDGVMIHSTLGELKPGDIPAEVRSKAISALLENYFVDNTVLQSGYPLDMRYAGPREALLHALFRQNYGCSHLIVGRDHAGVGDFYGPFDAHNIFDEIQNGLITQPLKIDWTFWCNKCAGMSSMKTCPHGHEDRLLLSGSKLRQLLSEDLDVPDNFSRPEVLEILRQYYAGLKDDEKVKVELKGHSAK